MKTTEAKTEPSTSMAFESVGVTCVRAAIVALVLGMVEGVLLGQRVHQGSAGMGLATAALWFPAAFLSLLPGAYLARLMPDRRRRKVALFVFGGLLAVAAIIALQAPSIDVAVGSPLHVAPIEIVSVIALGWAASVMRFEGAMRRPAAYVGLVLVVLVQLYGNRWIDQHRPFAGLIADASFVPRFMLRLVLRRFA